MNNQIKTNFSGKISETADTTPKQETDKQEITREPIELLRLKACILNHARRRPHQGTRIQKRAGSNKNITQI
jgi:hypothetical protein